MNSLYTLLVVNDGAEVFYIGWSRDWAKSACKQARIDRPELTNIAVRTIQRALTEAYRKVDETVERN